METLTVRPEVVALGLVGPEQLVVRPEVVQTPAMTVCNSDCVNKGVIIKVL